MTFAAPDPSQEHARTDGGGPQMSPGLGPVPVPVPALLCTGGSDGTLRMWDASRGHCRRVVHVGGGSGSGDRDGRSGNCMRPGGRAGTPSPVSMQRSGSGSNEGGRLGVGCMLAFRAGGGTSGSSAGGQSFIACGTQDGAVELRAVPSLEWCGGLRIADVARRRSRSRGGGARLNSGDWMGMGTGTGSTPASKF